RSFKFYRWLLTLPTRDPPAPFVARGSSSPTSRHGPRRLGLPRATLRNRVPSGTSEVVRQPRASRSEHRESDRSVKPSIPHTRMYLSWPLSPPTPTFTLPIHPQDQPTRHLLELGRLLSRQAELYDLSAVQRRGILQRFPKVLRYIKLNYLCHDNLLF